MKKIEIDLKTEAALGELADQFKALPRNGTGKRVQIIPEELRNQVVVLIRSHKIPVETTARRLGVSGNSIRAWNKHFRSKTAARKRSSQAEFRSMEITPELQQGSGLVLELTGGAKVHGLTIDQLRRLMKEIGAGG